MNVQIENAMPGGFVYERTHNVIHGAVNGTAFLIVPVMAQNQFRIQLHADIEKSKGKENLPGRFKPRESCQRPGLHHPSGLITPAILPPHLTQGSRQH